MADAIFKKGNFQSTNVITPNHKALKHIDKTLSRRLTAIRLTIENVFGLLQNYKILRETWTRTEEEHHKVFVFLAYLHNCRIFEGLTLRNDQFIQKNRDAEYEKFFCGYDL